MFFFILLKDIPNIQNPPKMMNSFGSKKEKTSIHKIRELQLNHVIIEQHYDIIKEIGSGDYGKVMLAQHKNTNTQVRIAFRKNFMIWKF